VGIVVRVNVNSAHLRAVYYETVIVVRLNLNYTSAVVIVITFAGDGRVRDCNDHLQQLDHVGSIRCHNMQSMESIELYIDCIRVEVDDASG
jgi:hypothetical protein